MCTVSYIPLATGYLLSTNRDEDPKRETTPPRKSLRPGGRMIAAPRDLEKGGTWIATDEQGRTACLLNGAFEKHLRRLPYRKSRGQIVLEAFEADNFHQFIEKTTLDGIEPFTLILLSRGLLLQMAWDGRRKHSFRLPEDKDHLWSSPTLYSQEQHMEKEHHFKDYLQQGPRTAERLLQLHGTGGKTPFVLDRPGVRTVSITQVRHDNMQTKLAYYVKKQAHEPAIALGSISF